MTASDDIVWIRLFFIIHTSSHLCLVESILATLADQSVKSFRIVLGKLWEQVVVLIQTFLLDLFKFLVQAINSVFESFLFPLIIWLWALFQSSFFVDNSLLIDIFAFRVLHNDVALDVLLVTHNMCVLGLTIRIFKGFLQSGCALIFYHVEDLIRNIFAGPFSASLWSFYFFKGLNSDFYTLISGLFVRKLSSKRMHDASWC